MTQAEFEVLEAKCRQYLSHSQAIKSYENDLEKLNTYRESPLVIEFVGTTARLSLGIEDGNGLRAAIMAVFNKRIELHRAAMEEMS